MSSDMFKILPTTIRLQNVYIYIYIYIRCIYLIYIYLLLLYNSSILDIEHSPYYIELVSAYTHKEI